MKCESCKLEDYIIVEASEEGHNPYLLCSGCQKRLINFALRPLEFFNLTAIHGNTYLLSDSFYDDDTGEAIQAYIDVVDEDLFPYPKLEDVENNLSRLIDYSFVSYFVDDVVIEKLKLHEKIDILQQLKERVKYNKAIKDKAFEVAASVLGKSAKNWIRTEWAKREDGELLIYAKALAYCLDVDEAFRFITKEIEDLEDKSLSLNIAALNYLKNERVLDWIETMTPRIHNISFNWGQLAASSKFDWERAVIWLNSKRPLSLIALDALYYSTSKSERRNQSLWMRELNPNLIGRPISNEIITTLKAYLENDNVPRTRNTIKVIIENVS